MAIRHCGHVKINCTYEDAKNRYRCALSIGGKRKGTQFIGVPASLEHAVDSPQSFDSAAHAAIAFALDEGMIQSVDVDMRPSGVGIRRRLGQQGFNRVVGHPDFGGLRRN